MFVGPEVPSVDLDDAPTIEGKRFQKLSLDWRLADQLDPRSGAVDMLEFACERQRCLGSPSGAILLLLGEGVPYTWSIVAFEWTSYYHILLELVWTTVLIGLTLGTFVLLTMPQQHWVNRAQLESVLPTETGPNEILF